jgi:signal transduction histidine kinase
MTADEAQVRQRSGLRLLVAAAGLAIYLLDPSEHPGRRPLALGVLAGFLAYAAALFALRRTRSVPSSLAPWLDLAWVTAFVGVSEATSGVFYPLYLLPITYASFGGGFRPGIAVVVASAASYLLVGLLTSPSDPGVDPIRYFVRSLYLLILGYVTAVWGGYEVRSRSRLALLREVTALSNPRFGVDRTVGRLLEALRAFYGADSCRLVVEEEGRTWMRTAARGAPPGQAADLPREVADVLLAGPGDAAVRVALRHRAVGPEVRVELLAAGASEPTAGEPALGAALAEALEAGALVSVPFRYHANARGRLHLVRVRPEPFAAHEVDFLRQVIDQVSPVLDNVRLVDRLASEAAEEERLRIARDLHDSVIQPYLGLRLGLAAVQGALAEGRTEEGRENVSRLVELADAELQTLRGYVRELRTAGTTPSAGPLDTGVRRFCERFSAATGIRVDVALDAVPALSDRLAAEVFQMVAEALSNVRRHTSAGRAGVRLSADGERLRLAVENDGAGQDDRAFSPRSLGERAAALGGTARVERPAPGRTAVHVEIPL